MKHPYLFLLLSFLNCSCNAQSHTDLQEYGFKGKIRKVIDCNYIEVPPSLNKDSAVLYEKDILYFNKQGNIDSTLSYVLSDDEDSLIKDQKNTVEYKNGKRLEIAYKYDTKESNTIKRNVFGDSAYEMIITDKEDGQSTVTKIFLDENYLVYKTKIIVIDKDKRKLLSKSYVLYNKDSTDLYHKMVCSFSDMDNGALQTGYLTYDSFDKNHNPQKVMTTHADKKHSLEMRTYEFEYY